MQDNATIERNQSVTVDKASAVPKAIIIAAGMGNRLGSLTEDTPKCLLPVNGKSILEHQVEAFQANGITDITIIKGFCADKIDYPQYKTYINDDYENNNILASLMYADKELNGSYIVSYSDILYTADVVKKLLESDHDVSLVVDTDWRGRYVGRTEHPESEAEKAALAKDDRIYQLGKVLNETEMPTETAEFIGLLKFSEKAARLLPDAYAQAKTEFENQPFYNAPSIKKAYLTDMFNHLIKAGTEIHGVRIQGQWCEIDTEQDLEYARDWSVHGMNTVNNNFLKAQGQRVLSELNDFKRTVPSCAKEMNLPVEHLQKIIAGDVSQKEMSDFIDAFCDFYPVERASVELSADDTCAGVKVMRDAESKKTARIFDRRNRDGELTPYYEYRDTATSRLCAFRPEWIKELRVVNDNDPENPDVAYNNGHFMHQLTFFVGPVNFYYQLGDKKYCAEMNTGDSNYITPYFPHSFAVRSETEEGYIVAVTFGGDVRRSLDELYRMGPNRASEYLVDVRNQIKGVQDLLEYHLKNALMTREILQDRLNAKTTESINVLDDTCDFTQTQLEAITSELGIEVSDLTLAPYRSEEEVVVRKIADTTPYAYPSDNNARYTIWPAAQCRRMPLVKAFKLQLNETTAANVPDLTYGLHSYLFNYSDASAVLRWEKDGKMFEDILAPGDSAYVQPFIKFDCYKQTSSNDSNDETSLFLVGIPGSINLSVQREMSAFAHFDRVVSEDKCWYST